MCAIVSTGYPERIRGFTLVEIAIAVFIITLLLGSILVPLATQVEQRQISEARKTLEDLREALIGHALAKGFLPCPDATAAAAGATPNDGIEDVDANGRCIGAAGAISGTSCPVASGTTLVNTECRIVGNVPWVTLGLGASDPWGNRYRYSVDMEFAARSPSVGGPFSLSSAANICVGPTAIACVNPWTGRLTAGMPGPDGAVAVILTHGKNGRSAMNATTNVANTAATSADELDNTGGTGFTSRQITALAPNDASYFDDIVIWLSKYPLYQRMVAAGKLP